MYPVLIYIVIVFIFILFTKDTRVVKEGQSLESYKYLEFQPIIDDEILDEQLKKHLNKYTKDMDTVLKNTIDKNKVSKAIKEELDSGEDKENILYDIYVRDTLGELNNEEHDKQSYENYLKNYIKFNDNKREFINIPYSEEQVKLFKKKYKSDILYSNESDYVDKKYYENIVKDNEQEDISLPGLIDTLGGKVINNMRVKEDIDNETIDISGAEFCCDYSTLKIENVSLLTTDELNKVNHRMRDINHEDIDLDKEKEHINAYNYPYYEYMKGEELLYKPLYLNYNKTKNIGSINL